MPREIRHHLIVLSSKSLRACTKCARKLAKPWVRRDRIFSSYDLPHDGDHGPHPVRIDQKPCSFQVLWPSGLGGPREMPPLSSNDSYNLIAAATKNYKAGRIKVAEWAGALTVISNGAET
jgi:hypothetical protein